MLLIETKSVNLNVVILINGSNLMNVTQHGRWLQQKYRNLTLKFIVVCNMKGGREKGEVAQKVIRPV